MCQRFRSWGRVLDYDGTLMVVRSYGRSLAHERCAQSEDCGTQATSSFSLCYLASEVTLLSHIYAMIKSLEQGPTDHESESPRLRAKLNLLSP